MSNSNIITLRDEQFDFFRIPEQRKLTDVHHLLLGGSNSNAYDVVAALPDMKSEDLTAELAETGLIVMCVRNGESINAHVLNKVYNGVITPQLQSAA